MSFLEISAKWQKNPSKSPGSGSRGGRILKFNRLLDWYLPGSDWYLPVFKVWWRSPLNG